MWKNVFKVAILSLILSSGMVLADYSIRTADTPPQVKQVFEAVRPNRTSHVMEQVGIRIRLEK